MYEAEMMKCAQKKSSKKDQMKILELPTGGSVANSAFSFAQQLGAKTIVLVGQDLALTDNKTHADGTFEEKMKETGFVGRRTYRSRRYRWEYGFYKGRF